MNQEILHRLQLTFDQERQKRMEKRDLASKHLCNVLAELIELISGNTTSRWRSDPFAFRTIRLAFDRVLTAMEPPGEIKSRPEEALEKAVLSGLSAAYLIGGDTPEEMANIAAQMILIMLRGSFRAPFPLEIIPQARSDREFGMSDASRHLQTGDKS